VKAPLDLSIPEILRTIQPTIQTSRTTARLRASWWPDDCHSTLPPRSCGWPTCSEGSNSGGFLSFHLYTSQRYNRQKEAYAAQSFRKYLPSTEYQELYALRFQQVTAELRKEFTPLCSAGPTFHSADSQQGCSGLLQPPTTEIAPDVRFPPPPKAYPRALLAKRQQQGNSSARLPLGVELAEADAKRRKQDASAQVARADAVTMFDHSNVEVPGLRRGSRQQAIAVKSKAVASEGERTTTASSDGGRGGWGGGGLG
jgi:hypothetical protein